MDIKQMNSCNKVEDLHRWNIGILREELIS